MHDWHDQQLASQQKSYSGLNTAGRIRLDHEEDLVSSAHDYKPLVSQDLYRDHGTASRLETSGPGSDPAPPEQAPDSIVTPIETGPDTFTQEVHDLGGLLADQICTCAACLECSYWLFPVYMKWHDEHPESRPWTFGCRIAGCLWTTKDSPDRIPIANVEKLRLHELERDHYGKPGDYKCPEANCKFITKRFGDLKRHCSSKHCIKPKKLNCPVLSCKYHQDGFTRKDKLNSHYQKVHEGKSQPGKPNQAIKPKVGDNA